MLLRSGCVGVEVGCGVDNLGVIVVWVCKPVSTQFIYLAFEKTDPFIYFIIRNVDLFIYCPLIFCTHLLLEVRQISQSIHWIPREQAASKNLWAKICAYTRMSEKWAFYIGIQKNRVIYILFVEKRGPIIYLAALKKGAIRHAHPYYAIYRKLPPSFYPGVKSSIPYLVCKKRISIPGINPRFLYPMKLLTIVSDM